MFRRTKYHIDGSATNRNCVDLRRAPDFDAIGSLETLEKEIKVLVSIRC